MKTCRVVTALCLAVSIGLFSCSQQQESAPKPGNDANEAVSHGQSGVQDDQSQQDVVKIAVGSPDHTTLVTAVKAAELVDALSNAGPFTVFAPINSAFSALPAGTVDDLLKPENKDKLTDILYGHVTTSVFDDALMRDGLTVGMVSGARITFRKNGDKWMVGDANILGSARGSNGIVHIIDKVLLPK
ncbi:hypothetical protein MASR2M18_13740 [Ignavibacteria bacterium]|nr:fasciclin domain-containing protein [Bacteroidota bacterium]MCZ2132540.1 fasciclin domain-containing protein [Bacteroidota bacterium]